MSTQRKIILGIIGLVVILAIAFAVVLWPVWTGQSQEGSAPGTTTDGDTVALSEEDILYGKAEKAAVNGGAEAGQEIIDDKLETTTDPRQQATLYILKSNLASTPDGGNSYQQSLEYAQKAESLYPTYESALVVATLQEALKNKTEAAKYYKLYLARVPQDVTELNPGDKEYYTNRVKELEAGQ